MKKHVGRRLATLDAIILVAALAFGLGAWLFRQRGMFYRGASYEPVPAALYSWMAMASILALALCYGVAIASLRPPRPTWRRLSMRPGFVACFTVVVASLVRWAIQAPHTGFANPQLMSAWMTVLWSYTLIPFPPNIAPALVSAWVLLKASGRWNTRTEVMDRIGVFLGGVYLVMAALCWSLSYGI